MARFTKKDLENEVTIKNIDLVKSGKPFYFISKPRNGYNAVDVHEANSGKCIENIECGSALLCAETLDDAASSMMYSSDDYYLRRPSKFTREGALRAAIHCGIDFTKDVHTLSFDEKDVLHALAVKTRFYKSRSSQNSLSRGSCFFVHLSKIQAKKRAMI